MTQGCDSWPRSAPSTAVAPVRSGQAESSVVRGRVSAESLEESVQCREESTRKRRAQLDAIAELTARTGGYDGDPF